jgi:hypothetical protein
MLVAFRKTVVLKSPLSGTVFAVCAAGLGLSDTMNVLAFAPQIEVHQSEV